MVWDRAERARDEKDPAPVRAVGVAGPDVYFQVALEDSFWLTQ